MTGRMPRYEMGENGSRRTVRVSCVLRMKRISRMMKWKPNKAIIKGFLSPEYAGKVGNFIDAFKAAEKILADHYGSAKMVESHYGWRPYIRY